MSRHPVALTRYALVAAVAMLFAMAGPAFAQDLPTIPIPATGQSTTELSIAWSQATFADGSADTVILARNDDFADSLASGALQAELNAPLLLSAPDVYDPRVAAEVQRLGAESAVILGGEAAMGPNIENGLEAQGLETTRIAGANRAETAALILSTYFPNAADVYIARADAPEGEITAAFADSLSLAGYSSVTSTPVLLSNTNTLNAETEAALAGSNIERATVVGGTAAISAEVESAVATAIEANQATDPDAPPAGPPVQRIAGAARDVTALNLSLEAGYGSAADAGRVILLEGYTETAWAGFASAVQAGNNAAIVIADGETISQATTEFLAGSGVPLVCGPGTTEAACDAAAAAIAS